MSSGEENEIELFSNRAKLYRFDDTMCQWKERGVGNIKILKHKNAGQVRILMRRDQVLKICCNHVIVKGMRLIPRDEKSFTWLTLGDLSDLAYCEVKFTIKFNHAKTASAFQDIFTSYVTNVWDCQICYIRNEESLNKCVVCGADRVPTSSIGTCSVALCQSSSMPVSKSPANTRLSTSLPVTSAIVIPSKPVFSFHSENVFSKQVNLMPPSSTGFSFASSKFVDDSSKLQN